MTVTDTSDDYPPTPLDVLGACAQNCLVAVRDHAIARSGGRVELREGFRERSRDRRVRPAIARVSLLLTLSKG